MDDVGDTRTSALFPRNPTRATRSRCWYASASSPSTVPEAASARSGAPIEPLRSTHTTIVRVRGLTRTIERRSSTSTGASGSSARRAATARRTPEVLDAKADSVFFETEARRFSVVWRTQVPIARHVGEFELIAVGEVDPAWWRSRALGLDESCADCDERSALARQELPQT